MGLNPTLIEWVIGQGGSPGFTANHKTGCENHTNGLCHGGGFPCYAYKLAHGRLKDKYLKGHSEIFINGMKSKPVAEAIDDPFYPRRWPERLDEIRQRQKPAGIFLDDMADWMGDYWPEEWTEAEIQVMRDCPQHRFYTLTKQPQNLAKFSPFPDNCWVGVTVTANGFAPGAYYALSRIKAKVRFISFEPLMGCIGTDELRNLATISDWFIIGAQTKPYKPPRLEWVEEIVKAADQAGVKVFQKDNLAPVLPTEWRGYKGVTRLRQEVPG